MGTLVARLQSSRPAPFVLAAGLGLLHTFSFAPWDIWAFQLIALFGLIALWWHSTPVRAALIALVFGMTHFAGGLYWIYISTHIYGGAPGWLSVLLIVALAFILSLFFAGAGLVSALLRRSGHMIFALIAVPSAWLAAELLRSWVGTGFPWFALGYAWIDTPLKLWAPIVGVYGLSLVVAMVAGAFWLIAFGLRLHRIIGLTVLVVLSAGLVLTPPVEHWTRAKAGMLPVALVQGNVPMEVKWQQSWKQPTLDRYMALTRQAWDARVIIWPEVAIPALYHRVAGDYIARIDAAARQADKTVVIGVMDQRTPDAPLYNMVVAVGADRGQYYKRHLVPFGEYFPVPEFMMDLVNVYGLDYSDFAHGPKQQTPIKVAGEQIGLSICFEDVFGREIVEPLPDASLLVNLTNDAWFADSTAPHQHLQIARMRAVEAGRQLLRVANTGITTVIEADGTLGPSSPQFKMDILKVNAQPRTGLTPYGRWRDGPLVMIAMVGLLLASLIRRRG